MKRALWPALVFAGGVALGLAGCTKDSTGPGDASQDEQAIQRQVVQVDSIAEFSSSENELMDDQAERDEGTLTKALTPVKPFRWGRKVTGIKRTVVVEVHDSVAVALITKNITGVFILSASYDDAATFPDTILRKPFSEQVQRKVKFARIARTAYPERNWVPVAITLVEGNALPDASNKFDILSLELTLPLYKDTVTDPLNTWYRFFRLRGGVPVVWAGDSVEISVKIYSTDADTELAFLRYRGEDPRRLSPYPVIVTRRVRMNLVEEIPAGPGSLRFYKASFCGWLEPYRLIRRSNAVVDVYSRGSLFDDAAPLSNRFWGVPYVLLAR